MSVILKASFSHCIWLTYDDGVDFTLNLQGAAATAKYVDNLFQLRLLDHQVVFLLKVLLQPPTTADMKTLSQHSSKLQENKTIIS